MKNTNDKCNLRHLIHSEILSASAYLERLCHTTLDVMSLQNDQKLREIFENLAFELMDLIEMELFLEQWSAHRLENTTPKEVRRLLQSVTELVNALFKLEVQNETLSIFAVQFINLLYRHGHKLHSFCFTKSDFEVPFPRLSFLAMSVGGEIVDDPQSFDWAAKEELPLFFIPDEKQNLEIIETGVSGQIHSLEIQREKRYLDLLNLGHREILNQHYSKAQDYFEKALKHKQSAEIHTLIGWSHALQGNYVKAKNYCLKAIQNDSEYGPPYNDMGTYLLKEGQHAQALKWFALAKKSLNYQNREYPYINTGRIYVEMGNYTKALQEFEMAKSLAPFRPEIGESMAKIKKVLSSANTANFDPATV